MTARVESAPLGEAGARAAYRAVCDASPHAAPFADLALADAVCDAFGLAGRIAVAHAEGPPAAAVLFEKRLGPLRAAALPPMLDLNGPVAGGALREADVHRGADALAALAAWAGRRYAQATWALGDGLADARPLAWAGWRLRPTWHYALALHPAADPADAFRPSNRRLVRHHDASGEIEVRAARDVRPVVALAVASLARKGLGATEAGRQAAVAQAAVDAGLARAWTAHGSGGGPPLAGVVALVRPPAAVYWVAGSAGGDAPVVLAAHLARAAREAGCAQLSWGGANVPSVAAFKRSLGGELGARLVARWARGPARLRDAAGLLRG